MDFFTWLVSGAEQQQQADANKPDPTVTVAPVQADSTDGTLDLPDWSPSPADIPDDVAGDAARVDAFEVFGADLHNDFKPDEIGHAFDQAYVGSYPTEEASAWGDGYVTIESDTLPDTVHVFKDAPVTLYRDMTLDQMNSTPPPDDSATDAPQQPAAAPVTSSSTPTKAAKGTKAKQARTASRKPAGTSSTSSGTKPPTHLSITRLPHVPGIGGGVPNLPNLNGPNLPNLPNVPGITSRSAIFRPWMPGN